MMLGSSFGEEEASNWGPSLVMDDALSHLGAMAEQEATIFNGKIAVDARIAGVWEGKTSKELGGYMQRIEFKNDCLTAEVGEPRAQVLAWRETSWRDGECFDSTWNYTQDFADHTTLK